MTQPVRLGHAEDRDGVLVYDGNVLVAILSRLTSTHGDIAGCWFLECAFGLELDDDDIFPDLPAACGWIEQRLANQDR